MNIARQFGVSDSLLGKLRKQFNETGNIDPASNIAREYLPANNLYDLTENRLFSDEHETHDSETDLAIFAEYDTEFYGPNSAAQPSNIAREHLPANNPYDLMEKRLFSDEHEMHDSETGRAMAIFAEYETELYGSNSAAQPSNIAREHLPAK